MESDVSKPAATGTLPEPAPMVVEKKREIISVQVTPEEKRKITTMAIKERGISVSEFVRTKIFLEPKQPVAPAAEIEEPLRDEERQTYEDTIDALNSRINELKETVVNLKVLAPATNNAPANIPEPPAAELQPAPGLIHSIEDDFKTIIERLLEFRTAKLATIKNPDQAKEYGDADKFLKLVFIRGLRRMYNNGCLKDSTGLTYDDMKALAVASGNDFDEA